MQEDADAFGLTLEDYTPAACDVLPCNWDTVMAFLAAQTQWRWAAPGGGGALRTGLDYPAARVAIEAAGLDFKAVFDGLRVMEDAVLAAD